MLGEEDAGGAVPEKVDPPLRLDERALASGSDKGKLRAIAQRLLVTSALGASSRRCGVRGRLPRAGEPVRESKLTSCQLARREEQLHCALGVLPTNSCSIPVAPAPVAALATLDASTHRLGLEALDEDAVQEGLEGSDRLERGGLWGR